MSALERWFGLRESGSTVRTELLAGCTTFLTMAYIIFLQPLILSGAFPEEERAAYTGAVMVATCLAAALATAVMALYARYPIAQAPGMGENVVFVAVAAAAVEAGFANGWAVALGVVFVSGAIFLALSLLGVREAIINAVSPSLKNAMAVGIGLFIAFIGLQHAGLVVANPVTLVDRAPNLADPDLFVFGVALLVTAVLHVRRVRGSILWGILAAAGVAALLRVAIPAGWAETPVLARSDLYGAFALPEGVVALPPSLAPTFLRMDLGAAVAVEMLPYVVIFLFMDMFDTIGTLVGVSEQAGLLRDGRLPRASRALVSDAVGTVAGACLGTSTVTSYIESATGVEQGGRTGLTGLAVAVLFLLALFFSPLVAMVGSYPAITAGALVIVGAMMLQNVRKIEWDDYSESVPAFLTLIGIPLTYSIADGLALGFVSYPLIKLLAGRGREVSVVMYALAVVLVGYFLLVPAV